MAEVPTTPSGEVASEADLVSRTQAYIEQFDAEQDDTPLELQPEEPEGQAEESEQAEPTEEAQPAAVDEFEIVFNGQPEKLTRAQVIEFAQKGKDYTQKTQALAEQSKAVQANLQRTQEMVNLAPVLAQDMAAVRALQANLAQYQNVDWVKVATDDPLEYPAHRAKYDVALQAYQQAMGQLQQNAQAYQQHSDAVSQQNMQSERQALRQIVPEWANDAVYEKETPEIVKFLVSSGVPHEAIQRLGAQQGDSVLTAIARKAWLYDSLMKGKAAKVGQVREAPPITRSTASTPVAAAQTQERQRLSQKLAKTGSTEDATALLLNRWKR